MSMPRKLCKERASVSLWPIQAVAISFFQRLTLMATPVIVKVDILVSLTLLEGGGPHGRLFASFSSSRRSTGRYPLSPLLSVEGA